MYIVLNMKIFLILHNIRSEHNVGSMFRTADAAGASKIYLTGYTPAPIDRFGRKSAKISKVALGAEESVSWEKPESALELIQRLVRDQVEIVCVEQDKRSVDYKKFTPIKDTAYVFGDEVRGLSKEILDVADKIIEIPMKGEKESLNVSVTAGIILFNT